MIRMHQLGYTLVEMLVSLAVTSIVISGTYAAYVLFSKQQQTIIAQTEIERNLLFTVDLMQSDIRMAGYKDINDLNEMKSNQPIVITSPSDVSFVYDDYQTSGSVFYRVLVRYYIEVYKKRNRLYRQVRNCDVPSTLCTVDKSSPIVGRGIGEPLLDWVDVFEVIGENPKKTGSFSAQPQTVQVRIGINAPKIIDGVDKSVKKSVTFLGRAKNISLVP